MRANEPLRDAVGQKAVPGRDMAERLRLPEMALSTGRIGEVPLCPTPRFVDPIALVVGLLSRLVQKAPHRRRAPLYGICSRS